MGGWKKEGGGKPHEWHPSQKGVLDPPSYGTFSTPLRCQCSVFPVQKSTTEQTRSSFGGVQKFSGERVLWYVFLPPYVLHPPISPPNFFHAAKSALSALKLAPPWREPPEAPLDLKDRQVTDLGFSGPRIPFFATGALWGRVHAFFSITFLSIRAVSSWGGQSPVTRAGIPGPKNLKSQCSFVYPYPSASALAGGNSDHGPRKTRTKTQTTPDSIFIGERRNSDHGLSFSFGKTQTMVWVSGVFGVGVDEGALKIIRNENHHFKLALFKLQVRKQVKIRVKTLNQVRISSGGRGSEEGLRPEG